MLRLPDGLRDRIKTVAEANNRSMNAEIVAVLEENYPAPLEDDDGFDRIYKLMGHVYAGQTEAEQDQRIAAANAFLRQANAKLELKFSLERDARGDRIIYMTVAPPEKKK